MISTLIIYDTANIIKQSNIPENVRGELAKEFAAYYRKHNSTFSEEKFVNIATGNFREIGRILPPVKPLDYPRDVGFGTY